MKYVLFTLNGFLELFKKRGEKTLFEYTKKGNFEDFINKGQWGFVFLEETIERGYFEFFLKSENFPGEGFLRALKYKIPVNTQDSFFIAKFVFSDDMKILETDVKLNFMEKIKLLEDIKKIENNFEYYVYDEDIILKFKEDFPLIETFFPNEIKGFLIETLFYRNRKFETINKIMKISKEILEVHEINKVRLDLNEVPANFLYIYGLGRHKEKICLNDILKRKIFYFSNSKILNGIVEFLKIENLKKIEKLKDEEIYWLNFSADFKLLPSMLIKNFEFFSQEVLKEIPYREDTRFLFIFDPFINENLKVKKMYSLFLAVNFYKVKRKYKRANLLFQEFLK
ncbi:MAG: hypothetical protein NC926_05020 [Candidatus Omnitrophica bacterium]|nr:hypothetical protein [Candidatus Omnitrophota bacterium]MCM8807302.1 hypothetical protein [Candidatus Omnitrophota bacterium]